MPRIVYIFLLVLATLTACDKSEVRLHHLYLTAPSDMITPGDTMQLSLLAYPADATTGFPSEVPVWSTSDSTIATVNQSGIMTAVKYGQCIIRVDMGHYSAEKMITVSAVVDIPDEYFRNFLLERYDADHDGQIAGYETYAFVSIDLEPLKIAGQQGVSLRGLEQFVNLQILRIENLTISDLDLRPFTNLRSVYLEACDIDTIDLRSNATIEDVRCLACPNLTAILFGSMTDYGRNNLSTLQCDRCDIRSLDLSRCGRTLGDIDCRQNPNLTTIDLSVDTMLHSVKYTADVTSVVWPDVDIDIIIRETE